MSRRRPASPWCETHQGSEVCRWCNLPACDHPLYEIVPGGCLRLIPIEEEGFGDGEGEDEAQAEEEDDEEGGDDPSRDRVFIDVVRVNQLRGTTLIGMISPRCCQSTVGPLDAGVIEG